MVLIWVALIFSMTFQEGTDSAKLSLGYAEQAHALLKQIGLTIEQDLVHTMIRKGAHITVYFFLGMWLVNALLMHPLRPKNAIVIALVMALSIASLDELIQGLWVEGRHGAWLDVFYDMVGASIGIVLMRELQGLTQKTTR